MALSRVWLLYSDLSTVCSCAHKVIEFTFTDRLGHCKTWQHCWRCTHWRSTRTLGRYCTFKMSDGFTVHDYTVNCLTLRPPTQTIIDSLPNHQERQSATHLQTTKRDNQRLISRQPRETISDSPPDNQERKLATHLQTTKRENQRLTSRQPREKISDSPPDNQERQSATHL